MARNEREDDDEPTKPSDDQPDTPPHRPQDPFTADIPEHIEQQIQQQLEYMNQIMQKFLQGDNQPPNEGSPRIYGMSLHIGPDGKPRVRKFSNSSNDQNMHSQKMSRERQTHVDVLEGENTLSVTMELPSVDKTDIELEATADTLTINVHDEEQPYHKKVDLPAKVDTDSAQVTYQNGILDIELDKTQQQEQTATTIHLD